MCFKAVTKIIKIKFMCKQGLHEGWVFLQTMLWRHCTNLVAESFAVHTAFASFANSVNTKKSFRKLKLTRTKTTPNFRNVFANSVSYASKTPRKYAADVPGPQHDAAVTLLRAHGVRGPVGPRGAGHVHVAGGAVHGGVGFAADVADVAVHARPRANLNSWRG